jgi:ABC-type polysaccharide/polyol phosphate transport system, ATPase component
MDKYAIQLQGLSKKYKRYKKAHHRLIEWISSGKLKKHEEFWALKDVSFDVAFGECVGIIGHNGAGKSTLLKLLSKSLWPTEGTISTEGNVVSLLELGTGFHPELTGIQNIYTSGKLLGYTDDYIQGKLKGIIEFSELSEQFLNQPVKSYSSGMYVRLAFSLFANLEPDVYIVDEALSVGDIFFQQKCFDFLQQLKSNGTAIILVTHDMQTVKKYCDRVMILEEGRIKHEGNPLEMVNLFYSLDRKTKDHPNAKETSQSIAVNAEEKMHIPSQSLKNVELAAGIRRGNGSVKIIGAMLCDSEGGEIKTAHTGDKIALKIYAEIIEDIADLTFGFQFSDRHNTVVFGQNGYMLDKKILRANKGDIIHVQFDIEMNLFQGLYTVMVASSDCQTEGSNVIYDWIEGCTTLEILQPRWRTFHGVAFMKSSYQIERSLIKEVN